MIHLIYWDVNQVEEFGWQSMRNLQLPEKEYNSSILRSDGQPINSFKIVKYVQAAEVDELWTCFPACRILGVRFFSLSPSLPAIQLFVSGTPHWLLSRPRCRQNAAIKFLLYKFNRALITTIEHMFYTAA